MSGVKTALLLWKTGKKTRGTFPEHPCDPLTRANVWGVVGMSLMSENCSVALCVCVCWVPVWGLPPPRHGLSRRDQRNVIRRRFMFGRWSRNRLPEESHQAPSTLLLSFSRLLILEIIKMKYRDATRNGSLSFDQWKVDRLSLHLEFFGLGAISCGDLHRISEEILCPLFWRCSGFFWLNLSVMDEKLESCFLCPFNSRGADQIEPSDT